MPGKHMPSTYIHFKPITISLPEMSSTSQIYQGDNQYCNWPMESLLCRFRKNLSQDIGHSLTLPI